MPWKNTEKRRKEDRKRRNSSLSNSSMDSNLLDIGLISLLNLITNSLQLKFLHHQEEEIWNMLNATMYLLHLKVLKMN